jgi:MFS family permease
MLGSALFAGWSATLLWVPPLADKYGRRTLFVWGCVANLGLYTVLMLSHNLWLSVACIFLIGALESIRISIGFAYCMELMYEPNRSFYGTVWNVNEGLIYFWATLYFWLIAKDWLPFISIGYALSIISTVGVFFYPESPCYLIKKEMYGEAEKSFQYIARINGRILKFDAEYFTVSTSTDISTQSEPETTVQA